MKILIVDDSLTVRMDLSEAFAGADLADLTDLEVCACASAAEARAALAGGPFDLVILDVVLPDGDGVALLKEIRDSAVGVAVILLSTEAEVRDRIRGLKTGADEYIAKPYDPGYILARARALLGRQSAASDAILIVDDSATFRARLKEALEQESYRVLSAATGEEGLRLAAAAHPAAMIVDGVLPGIDGAAVIRRIRMDAGLRDTPCILLTASEAHGAEIQALDAGADAFVRKDEEIAVMLARLAAVLRSVDGPRAGRREKPGLLDPKKILVVDDSETYLREVAQMLHTQGYEVAFARSGEEALELLAVQAVDCILLDLVMPGIGGQEACRRIKAAPALRGTPVIMLTAQEDRAAMIRGLGAGADDYVTKSSDFEVLRARILAQLRRKQFEDENRSIRERLVRQEMEAARAAAARELGEIQAVLAERKRSQEEMNGLQAELAHVSRWNAMGMMASSLAHELNQPLTAAKNYVTAARRTIQAVNLPQAVAARQLMDKAADQTMQAGAIIKNLRAFIEKRDTGRTLEDINPLVEGAIALGLVDGGHAGLKVRTEFAPDLPRVLANRIQIQQVLVNLFRNAIEAMAGAGRHELTIATSACESGFVGVTVCDTGPGISPEVLARLFQPFTTTKQDGMGIGLKICQSIIEAHGGQIGLTPNPDQGVTFRFALPVADETENGDGP